MHTLSPDGRTAERHVTKNCLMFRKHTKEIKKKPKRGALSTPALLHLTYCGAVASARAHAKETVVLDDKGAFEFALRKQLPFPNTALMRMVPSLPKQSLPGVWRRCWRGAVLAKKRPNAHSGVVAAFLADSNGLPIQAFHGGPAEECGEACRAALAVTPEAIQAEMAKKPEKKRAPAAENVD